jgi:hypothetical protein
MNIFPWSRSPYDKPDLDDDGLRAVLLPSGALVEMEQLRIAQELARRQEEEIRARAEEREAAVAAAKAEKAAQLLADVRDAGVLPSG